MWVDATRCMGIHHRAGRRGWCSGWADQVPDWEMFPLRQGLMCEGRVRGFPCVGGPGHTFSMAYPTPQAWQLFPCIKPLMYTAGVLVSYIKVVWSYRCCSTTDCKVLSLTDQCGAGSLISLKSHCACSTGSHAYSVPGLTVETLTTFHFMYSSF